jgi:hypothetical protein
MRAFTKSTACTSDCIKGSFHHPIDTREKSPMEKENTRKEHKKITTNTFFGKDPETQKENPKFYQMVQRNPLDVPHLRDHILVEGTQSRNPALLHSLTPGQLTRIFGREAGNVVLGVDLVATSTSRSNVGVVGGRDQGDRASGTNVGVTGVVNQRLQGVDRDLVLVVDDLVVNRARGTLDGVVGVKVKVPLFDGGDVPLNYRAWDGVVVAIHGVAVDGEEPEVVTLGANHNSKLRLVIVVHLVTSLLDGLELDPHNLLVISLGDTITEVDDTLRLLPRAVVEGSQESHQEFEDVLARDHFRSSAVSVGNGSETGSLLVRRSNHGSIRAGGVHGRGVRNICTQDHRRRSLGQGVESWHEVTRVASHLGVNLHAHVGAVLGLRLLNVTRLQACYCISRKSN